MIFFYILTSSFAISPSYLITYPNKFKFGRKNSGLKGLKGIHVRICDVSFND